MSVYNMCYWNILEVLNIPHESFYLHWGRNFAFISPFKKETVYFRNI